MAISISSTGGTNSLYTEQMQEKMLSKIDTNSDGSVSKEEFLSNRPEDVSEAQANEMWSKLDTSDSGSLTGNEFLSAMSSQAPPPGPPPGESGGQDDSGVSSPASGSNTSELLEALLAAIKDYTQSSNYQNQGVSTSMMSSYV